MGPLERFLAMSAFHSLAFDFCTYTPTVTHYTLWHTFRVYSATPDLNRVNSSPPPLPSFLRLSSDRGGRAVAPSLCGPPATAGAAGTTAPATATPTPSTPSPSPARPRADASRGTWRSARPRWPPPTAAGRTTTARLWVWTRVRWFLMRAHARGR